jgi:hypothetical protein
MKISKLQRGELVWVRALKAPLGCTLFALACAGCSAEPDAGKEAPGTEPDATNAVEPNAADSEADAPSELETASLSKDRGISSADARQRLRWQARVPVLHDVVSQRVGSHFGGIWIDVKGGDRVKVAVAGSARDQTETARAAIDEAGISDGADVVEVARTLGELEEANDWLAGEIAALGRDSVLTAGLRTDLNAVELQTPRDGNLSEAERALLERAKWIGDGLIVSTYEGRVEARACTYPNCDPPLRGGNRITNSGVICTNAFVAQSRSDGVLYQFTAGHCVESPFDDSWSAVFTNGSTHVIGARHNSVFGANGDMAILKINNVAGWAPENWVHVTTGPDTAVNTEYPITAEGSSVIGMRICTTGGMYGRSDCGTVTQLGVTASYGGQTVNDLGRGDFCGTGGDSGAPMYASKRAYGLQVAGFSECDSLYQGIISAENQMNVDVIH